MALAGTYSADERFTVNTPNRWPVTRIELARSRLLRWIWVGVLFSGDHQGAAYGYVCDDFGNLVEIKYICASFAGSKGPI